MKKNHWLALAPCAAWAIYPLCCLLARVTGCRYRLRSLPVYLALIALVTVLTFLFSKRHALTAAALPAGCCCAVLTVLEDYPLPLRLLPLAALIPAWALLLTADLPKKLKRGIAAGCAALMMLLAVLGVAGQPLLRHRDASAYYSPDGQHMIEIYTGLDEALGGDHAFVRSAVIVPCGLGRFMRVPKDYYTDDWDPEPDLQWVDDNHFIFEGNSYSVQ